VVLVKEVFLDASQSTDPGGLALSYQWTVIVGGATGGASAGLSNANTATPTAFLGNGVATYVFMVTVTDSAGNSSTGTTTITYAGP
jgi:hypothetical protein